MAGWNMPTIGLLIKKRSLDSFHRWAFPNFKWFRVCILHSSTRWYSNPFIIPVREWSQDPLLVSSGLHFVGFPQKRSISTQGCLACWWFLETPLCLSGSWEASGQTIMRIISQKKKRTKKQLQYYHVSSKTWLFRWLAEDRVLQHQAWGGNQSSKAKDL